MNPSRRRQPADWKLRMNVLDGVGRVSECPPQRLQSTFLADTNRGG